MSKLINHNNIEKLAKIGYWEWWPDIDKFLLSEGLIKMLNFKNSSYTPDDIYDNFKKICSKLELSKLPEYFSRLKEGFLSEPLIFSAKISNSTEYFEVNADTLQHNSKNYIAGTIQNVTQGIKYNILKEKEVLFEKKITEIASRFMNEASFQQSLSLTLDDLGDLCNALNVSIFKIDNNFLVKEFEWNNSDKQKNILVKEDITPAEMKFIIDLVKEKKIIYYQNINTFPHILSNIKTNLLNKNIKSLIISGINKNFNTTGFIIVTRGEEAGKWDFADIHIIKMTSLIIGNALKQNTLYKTIITNEKRLNFALIAGKLGTWEIDFTKNTKIFDKRSLEIFGYKDNYINKIDNWFNKNIHSSFYKSYEETLLDCIEGKINYFEIEYKIKCKNGKYRWINDWGIVTEIDKDGKPVKMVGIIQDITRRKKNEYDLLTAKKKAELSDKLKTAFLANISHEIRTPMNGINGFAKLLYNNMVDEHKKSQYLEIIFRSSNRLLNLMNNLIDISRLETNQLKFFEKECSIDDIFNDIKKHFSSEIKKNTNIKFEIKNNVNNIYSYINIDDSRLKQILINLIDNAFKFTNSGKISVLCELDNSGNLLFTVKDSGRGISRENLDIIFDIFAQSEEDINNNIGGTGLGLPIAKQLVAKMGGTIAVNSTKGGGSTFYFTIPYNPTQLPSFDKNLTSQTL
jgi:PAS domain S-box-containing protein